jgi:hypothetical protein
VQAFLFFSLPLMLFDKSGACGKYGRKSEKQAAYAGTPFPGDDTSDNCYDAAGNEAQEVFMPV